MQKPTLAQAPIPHADLGRKEKMKKAWEAYHGDFPKPLIVDKGQPDDNVITNRCRPIIDKGVSFLFGENLQIEASDETSQPDTAIQDFLSGLWGNDDCKMTTLSRMAMNGGVCGQIFVKVIPPQSGRKYPRLVILDPLLVRIVTSPEDCDLHIAYIIEYPGSESIQKRQIIARVDANNDLNLIGNDDIFDTWLITNYVKTGQQDRWIPIGEPEGWEYPFAPILTSQNLPNPNEAWGIPDLTQDLINQNKVLNFVLSNLARIIKYHGHPKTVATGVVSTQISVAVDDVLCLPSPDSEIKNLEMISDLSSLYNFAAALRDSMNEQSRIPAIALGSDVVKGNVSGIALKLFFQPLLEKTTQKRRLSGELIREISRACLCLVGLITIEQFEDYPIELHWQELLPIDDQVAAQTAILLKQVGVSDYTILSELGYDPEDELEKSIMEDAKKLVNFSRGQGMPPMPPQQMQQATQEPESPFIGRG